MCGGSINVCCKNTKEKIKRLLNYTFELKIIEITK